MNTCMWAGSVGLTVRRARNCRPAHRASEQHQLLVPDLVGNDALDDVAHAVSRGMNSAPTA